MTIDVFDQFYSEVTKVDRVQLILPHYEKGHKIIAFNIQVVYTNYNPISIKKQYIHVFSYCATNNKLFFTSFDVKTRKFLTVAEKIVGELAGM